MHDEIQLTTEEKAKKLVDTIHSLNDQFDLLSDPAEAKIDGVKISDHIKQGLNPYIDATGLNDGKTLLEASKKIPDLQDYLSKENRAKLDMERLKKELYPKQEKHQAAKCKI